MDLIGSETSVDCLVESSDGTVTDVLKDPLEPEAAGSDNRRVAITFGGTAGAPDETRSDERQTTERGPLPMFFGLFPVKLGFGAVRFFLTRFSHGHPSWSKHAPVPELKMCLHKY